MTNIQSLSAALESFPLIDDQPHIEGPSLSVFYDADFRHNILDKNAYESKWLEELNVIQKFNDILKQSDETVNMLYTYRSCSKALPQVKTDEKNKPAFYEQTFAVLEPEIEKLKKFMFFQKTTVTLFCETISNMVNDKKKDVHSEILLLTLIKVLDQCSLLDALKNMKACLNNDFSFYKRAFSYLKKNVADDAINQENQNLQFFLAHQNSITNLLKTEVQQISGFDEILALMINQCATWIENDKYVLPTEKHCLLRAMPYILFLMDGDQNSKYNIFKTKLIKLDRFYKIFKKYPYVPLYGDMQIYLETYIRGSPHFDEKLWGVPIADTKIAQEYELVNHLESVRNAHHDYLAKFSNTINEYRAALLENKPNNFNNAKEICNTVLQGLQLLGSWSCLVLQQSAYKYARPKAGEEFTVEYERVVKGNYQPEEKSALVEFIAMIKGLANVMLREDGLLSPLIARCIHDEIQEFIQINLREMIRHASKKKKPIRSELLQLRFMAADWYNGLEPNDPALFGKKQDKDSERISIPSRGVGPSATQLDLIRNMTYGFLFISNNPQQKVGVFGDKDFSTNDVKALEAFYNRSHFFQYLLNYSSMISKITDLGDLWYREFYLELSKRLQFPIDMSLPWILTNHVLESRKTSLMEYVLYPLDLYNDAANRALTSLKQQFLYAEVEAEVNLCFDQLLFKLSDHIFQYYKVRASSIALDKNYREKLELIQTYQAQINMGRYQVPKSRLDSIMHQRHFLLLGRSIDVNKLISQRINSYLRQNIDYAISRFEASDITSIIELEEQLRNVRHTHFLLSQHFELEPYDNLFREVDESTSLVSFHGRIVLHVIFEFFYDLFPNWNFNISTQRFIRPPVEMTEDPVSRDDPPKLKTNFLYGSRALNAAFNNASTLTKRFFGTPHFISLIRVVGKASLPLIISECLQNLELKINNVLGPYIFELKEGMPPSSKLPIFDYGTAGAKGYFELKLRDLYAYPPLKTIVYQNFREFGNTVASLHLIEMALSLLDSRETVAASPFLGITPDNVATPVSNQPSPLFLAAQGMCTALESKPGASKAPSVLKDVTTNAWRADKIYRPLGQSTSLFRASLQRIGGMLSGVKYDWAPVGGSENGIMAIDNSFEFYRVWSALQLLYCLKADDYPIPELFGDGLAWAGCTLIYFLRQKERFEVFDFCYHIRRVQEATHAPEDAALSYFFRTAAEVSDLNNSIFRILQTYAPLPSMQPLSFRPPASDQTVEYIVSASEHPEQRAFETTRASSDPSYSGSSSAGGAPPPPVAAAPPPISNNPPPPPMGSAPPPPLSREAPPPPVAAAPPPMGGAPPPPIGGGPPPPPIGSAPPPPVGSTPPPPVGNAPPPVSRDAPSQQSSGDVTRARTSALPPPARVGSTTSGSGTTPRGSTSAGSAAPPPARGSLPPPPRGNLPPPPSGAAPPRPLPR